MPRKGFPKALKSFYDFIYSLTASADFDRPYNDEGSYQKIACDLTVGPNVGSNAAGDTDYIAPIMGNVLLAEFDAYEDTFVAADVGDSFTVSPAHGFSTGDGPFEFVEGSGVLPTGVSEVTLYWLIVTSTTAFQVATSQENALAGTEVTISTAGTAHATRLVKRIVNRLSKDSNYIAGLIGKYNVPGAVGSSYPVAAVIAEVGEECGTGKPDGVCSVVGGDGAAVTPRALYGVRKLNSNGSSDPDYGVDLQDDLAVGLGYQALAYVKAPLRLGGDVVMLFGAGAPSDGTTGDNVAGVGSLYLDTTNGNAYLQTAVITSPVWKLVTRAA
jgi:hypothetical protein